MIVLGIDSATGSCAAALWKDGTILAASGAVMARGHAESLMPMILTTMTEAGIDFSELDQIAVTVGPGSFTGVRVGLATARGLGLASGRPVVGVATTTALAHAAPAEERQGRMVLALIESGRTEPFYQLFSETLAPLTEPNARPLAEILSEVPPGPLLVVGFRVVETRDTVPLPQQTVLLMYDPDPAAIAIATASHGWCNGGKLLSPNPLYLRAAGVTIATPLLNP